MCKRTIVKAKAINQQVVPADGIISYDLITEQGCSAKASGTTGITLKREGDYLVLFNANATEGGTAGLITTQLKADGIDVVGASASATSTASTDVEDFAFSEIINVKRSCNCVDNSVTLTVVNAGTVATFTNAYLKVIKL